MIDAVSAEHIEYLSSRLKRGQTVESVARQYGLGYTRLLRWLRLYDRYGAGYFPPTDESMNPSAKNNEALRKLVEDYSLTRVQVAYLIGATPEAVKNWLRGESTSGYRKMPNYALELLQIKVAMVYADKKPETD